MTTSECNAPININTSSTSIKPSPDKLMFNYYVGNCTAVKKANYIEIEYDIADLPNNVKYKNANYVLKVCRLYKKSIHQINGKNSVAELILWHQHASSNANLLVCIPVTISLDKTSFGTLIPIEANKSVVKNFNSLKQFIPSGDFYSYSASNFTNCSSSAVFEYIVFPSSTVVISQTELNNIPNSSYTVTTNPTASIYKHTPQSAGGSIISFSDDSVFIDCQPIDAPEFSGTSTSSLQPPSMSGINFSKLRYNKFVQMLLVFIVFMIVMVIFFYSYEFTTGMFRELTKSVGKMNKES